MPKREKLIRRAESFTRSQGTGAPKDQRIAEAKRAFKLEFRAAGFSRRKAKQAVSVRFNQGK
ncbi:MAG: hypothetical protein IT510_11410 [Sulfuritalea sp.]|nr:hypothetical protein [Sulfuritalea sp.]